MATNFPDTSVNNPGTSAPWADGDIFDDTAESGLIYYWYDPVWKTKAEGDIAAGDLTVSSLNGGPLAGFRNLIINGDFRVWQRGTGPTKSLHLADRWETTVSSISGGTNTVELNEDGSINKFRCNLADNTNFFCLIQKIESSNVRCYAGQEMTLSWYSSNSSSSTYLSYQDSTDTEQLLPQVGNVISLGNNKYSQTFTLPTAQIGEEPNSRGLTVMIFPDGDTATPPADGSYDIWNVQLEPGPVATPFEYRPIGTELALCQRYYSKGTLAERLPVYPYSSLYMTWVNFPVPMRTFPDITAEQAQLYYSNVSTCNDCTIGNTLSLPGNYGTRVAIAPGTWSGADPGTDSGVLSCRLDLTLNAEL